MKTRTELKVQIPCTDSILTLEESKFWKFSTFKFFPLDKIIASGLHEQPCNNKVPVLIIRYIEYLTTHFSTNEDQVKDSARCVVIFWIQGNSLPFAKSSQDRHLRLTYLHVRRGRQPSKQRPRHLSSLPTHSHI